MLRTDAPLGRCGCAGRPWSAWFKGITSCCAARATAETPTTSHHCLLLHTGTKVPRLPFLTTFTFSLSIIAKACQGLLSPKLTNTASKQGLEGVVMVRSSADQAAMAPLRPPPSPPPARPQANLLEVQTFQPFLVAKNHIGFEKMTTPFNFLLFSCLPWLPTAAAVVYCLPIKIPIFSQHRHLKALLLQFPFSRISWSPIAIFFRTSCNMVLSEADSLNTFHFLRWRYCNHSRHHDHHDSVRMIHLITFLPLNDIPLVFTFVAVAMV